MSTLQIRKLQSGAFKHVDSIDGDFFLGRFNFKQEFNKAFLVEAYGAKRREYVIANISVYNYLGSAETFTNWTDLFNRLTDLGYNGIETNGIIPAGAYLSDNPIDYSDATLPLTGTELALVEQGGTFKKVAVSEFGGGEENVQSDWNQINILADDFIKNKPELFSGDYNDLINTPALVTNHSELNLDDGTNPHGTTKNDVGLGNADNTSDLGKPISNATQTALNGKANTIHSHVISDVTGLQTALNSKLDKVTTNDVEKVYIKNADGTQSTKPTSDFGTVKGTGTINRISKFTASGTIGDSQIFDDGTKVGIGTTSPQARLDVRAQGVLATDIVLRVRNSTDTQNFLVVNGAGDVYNNGAKGVNTNTFFGEYVGRNATGGYNAAIGVSALYANTTGHSNAAIGVSALLSNTTGVSNAAIGVSALFSNTTGASNAAIGVSALYANTTGYSNAAIGVSALFSNTTGNSNAAIGVSALQNNTTGVSNAAIGVSALQNNTTGHSNMAIGSGAGRLISNGSNNTITNNSIFIGGDTRALADNQTNQIVIGNNAIGQGSNSVVLGNQLITITQLRGQVIMGVFESAPTGIKGAIYYDSSTNKHRGFNGDWNDLY